MFRTSSGCPLQWSCLWCSVSSSLRAAEVIYVHSMYLLLHTLWQPTEWGDLKIDLLLLYMPALWGSLIIITWPVVRSYHYSALEIRQLFCCSCIAAEKIIPSDYLGFVCLLLMLFNIGIIWKQLDLLYVITLLGLHEHEISLLHSIPALTLLFSYYWSVMCAINNTRARKKVLRPYSSEKKKCYNNYFCN